MSDHADSSEDGSDIDVGSRSDSGSTSPDNQSDIQQHNFTSKWHVENLVDELNRFREKKTFCDVELVVNSQHFPAHRHILAAASDYFRVMFDGNFREKVQKEVELNGIAEDIFSLVLNFIYTGVIDISEDTFEDIFRAGNMYLLEELNKICEEYGELHMNNSNCVARYRIAQELNNALLEDVAYGYVRNHFSELVETEELYFAPMSLVINALKCEELEIKREEQACEFLIKYVEMNWDELQKKEDILALFTGLRLDSLDPAYIKSWLIDNDRVKTNDVVRKYLIGVHDHLAYNTPLPDSYTYPSIRQLTTPTRGIFLFGGKPSVPDDNNCQFISYLTYRDDPNKISHQITDSTKMLARNITTIPRGKCEFAASCSIRGDIYISGIGQKLNEMWKYVSPLNQWLQCTNMITSRCRHAMVNGTPNLLYVLGGATGYELADKNGEGGDSFNVFIEEYNVSNGTWLGKGFIHKNVLHPCAVYWKGYLYIIGGAQKRGRDFTRTIQLYDPKTETTSILSVALPVSVHCPKAVIIGSTVAVVGFHNSVAINMDGLTAVHTVNVVDSHMEHGGAAGGGYAGAAAARLGADPGQDAEDADEKALDILDTAAECMTVRKGTKVAWFGLQLFGRDLIVIGGQNTDNKAECIIKAMDIDLFLNQEPRISDVDWKFVGVLQQKQRFCTVTGLGVYSQEN